MGGYGGRGSQGEGVRGFTNDLNKKVRTLAGGRGSLGRRAVLQTM